MSKGFFNSKLGFVLSVTGSAVGLGTIWRFPYLVSKHNGIEFILLFVLFMLFFGLSLLIAEFVLGQTHRTNIFDIYKLENGKGLFYKIISYNGYLTFFAIFIIATIYFIISGWALRYFVVTVLGLISYHNMEASYYVDNLQFFLSSPFKLFIYSLVVIVVTAMVVSKDISEGIEKLSLIMMPVLLLSLIVLLIGSYSSSNSTQIMSYFGNFSFKKINFSMILDALSQSFYSLSLGIGAMITYASYLKQGVKIHKVAFSSVALTILISIIMSVIVIFATAGFTSKIGDGIAVSFVTLPMIFSKIKFGYFFASLFFFSMFLAAITSTVSILETIHSGFYKKFNVSKTKSLFFLCVLILLFSSINLLSFNVLKGFFVFGFSLFDLIDKSFSVIICFTAMGTSLFLGFLNKEVLNKELQKFMPQFLINLFTFTLRLVIPFFIVIILFFSFY